ncbi:uncharacterized protein MONBRDRAFT_25262 [Monosiga brevicollis MX1]|uniref:Protein-L-isoaspartate O-methyltransferase n=1 Tax=Monosiga brevicollis TaxID=81824 RepID=A9UYW2_MONBE|nr:uncharacterized protein MONBRDRAFT_25262 [Monosiga brevicollis MX1]EDQ89676.1 predicted protein [Monosiga brevicollis MX1]|eukprot:XP_001745705.1 hypothetical protein [Monosiga brevicollis MX1]
MASSNGEMVALLEEEDLLGEPLSQHFRNTDRAAFLPFSLQALAYEDQAVREGPYHHSAPHMYAMALTFLQIEPGCSFLNVGSGTGYLSCIVAAGASSQHQRNIGHALGNLGLNHGLEVDEELVMFSHQCVIAHLHETNADFTAPTFFTGNVHQLQLVQDGHHHRRYDRIYVGAAMGDALYRRMCQLLHCGGYLVGPHQDHLIRTLRLDEDTFTEQAFSSVMFADLVETANAPPVFLAAAGPSSLTHLCLQERIRTLGEPLNAKTISSLGLPRDLQQQVARGYPVLSPGFISDGDESDDNEASSTIEPWTDVCASQLSVAAQVAHATYIANRPGTSWRLLRRIQLVLHKSAPARPSVDLPHRTVLLLALADSTPELKTASATYHEVRSGLE